MKRLRFLYCFWMIYINIMTVSIYNIIAVARASSCLLLCGLPTYLHYLGVNPFIDCCSLSKKIIMQFDLGIKVYGAFSFCIYFNMLNRPPFVLRLLRMCRALLWEAGRFD